MSLRRAAALSVENGAVATYVHGAIADGMARSACLSRWSRLAMPSRSMPSAARSRCMSRRPIRCPRCCVARCRRRRARAPDLSEQARRSGKPENIIEKMVEGRLRKFYEEVTLEKQAFVIDPDKTIEQAIEASQRTSAARSS
ncbi:MAG: hypothetical protein HPM95_16665 [Alphaproteobacteria bacterium]|nr:hypothetical protein [Alphaproteobacteria bacterium]